MLNAKVKAIAFDFALVFMFRNASIVVTFSALTVTSPPAVVVTLPLDMPAVALENRALVATTPPLVSFA